MSAPGGAETSIARETVGNQCGGDLIEFHAAVLLGDVGATQSELTCFPHQFAQEREILVLELFDVGDDFLDRELFRRARDQQMLLGEIFRSKYFLWLALLNQEAAASDFDIGHCSHSRHSSLLSGPD